MKISFYIINIIGIISLIAPFVAIMYGLIKGKDEEKYYKNVMICWISAIIFYGFATIIWGNICYHTQIAPAIQEYTYQAIQTN
jgi:hypothetical protein